MNMKHGKVVATALLLLVTVAIVTYSMCGLLAVLAPGNGQ